MKASATPTNNINPIPAGMQTATCYGIIDLGTHHDDRYDKDKHEILILWELPDERITIEKDGEKKDLPRAISKRYTLSLNDKANLYTDLCSWRGRKFTDEELKGFDVEKVIGAPCLLNVTHTTKDGNTYANVSSVNPLVKGMAAPQKENPPVYFSFEDCKDDVKFPDGMPEWTQKIAIESKEYKALQRLQDGQSSPAVDAYDPANPSAEDTLDVDDDGLDRNIPF